MLNHDFFNSVLQSIYLFFKLLKRLIYHEFLYYVHTRWISNKSRSVTLCYDFVTACDDSVQQVRCPLWAFCAVGCVFG